VYRVFLTYGSEGNYLDAARRLASQAEKTKIFHRIELFDEHRLLEASEEWKLWSKELCAQDGIERYKQAAKAFLLLWAADQFISRDTILFYADPGCEFTNNRISTFRMRSLFQKANEFEGIAEQLEYPEYQYTHLKMLNFLDPERTFWDSGQVQNTFFLIKINQKSLDFARKWVLCIDPKLGIWKDPEPHEEQLDGFVSHRRDQSIFSLLWKHNGYATKKPYWEHGGRFGNLRGIALPVHTIRNRSGSSNLATYHRSNLLALVGLFFSIVADLTRGLRKKMYSI